jgi:hypothetical protein
MRGCAAPGGLPTTRQGEVGWRAHAWQAALTVVSGAGSGGCRPSFSQAGTQGYADPAYAGAPVSLRGHRTPPAVLIQLCSCEHAAPVYAQGDMRISRQLSCAA